MLKDYNNLDRDHIMETGIVKRFNKIKGYGFITPDSEDKEVFVHFSEIKTEGYKDLTIGQRVQFNLVMSERGECAKQVEII